jgi:hypothetical protein
MNQYGDDGGRLTGAILSEPGALNKQELDEFLKRSNASVDLTGEQFNDALWSGQFMSPDDQARADYLQMIMALPGVPAEHNAQPTPIWREGAVVNGAVRGDPGLGLQPERQQTGQQAAWSTEHRL